MENHGQQVWLHKLQLPTLAFTAQRQSLWQYALSDRHSDCTYQQAIAADLQARLSAGRGGFECHSNPQSSTLYLRNGSSAAGLPQSYAATGF